MSPTPFVVSRFVNPNGITSWRVDGRINGLRIRKNFKTRGEAGLQAQGQRLGGAGIRPLPGSDGSSGGIAERQGVQIRCGRRLPCRNIYLLLSSIRLLLSNIYLFRSRSCLLRINGWLLCGNGCLL